MHVIVFFIVDDLMLNVETYRCSKKINNVTIDPCCNVIVSRAACWNRGLRLCFNHFFYKDSWHVLLFQTALSRKRIMFHIQGSSHFTIVMKAWLITDDWCILQICICSPLPPHHTSSLCLACIYSLTLVICIVLEYLVSIRLLDVRPLLEF